MPAQRRARSGGDRPTLDYQTQHPLARRAISWDFLLAVGIIAIYLFFFTCIGIAIIGGD